MSKKVGKAIVTLGYVQYVVDVEDAVAIANILSTAELYAEKWRKAEEGGTTYYVFEQEAQPPVNVKVLPTALYNLYKLSGKPEEN